MIIYLCTRAFHALMTSECFCMCCNTWRITHSRIGTYKAWKWEDRLEPSQIVILTLTEASASGEIKDRAACGSRNSPQKDELSTADGLTRWAFLLTEIWAQLYNPLSPKVQTIVCWVQNCRVEFGCLPRVVMLMPFWLKIWQKEKLGTTLKISDQI